MNIKVECGCGTRFSFEVEPQEGRMPFTVNCPNCNADGTETANATIAETLAANAPGKLKLRIQGSTSTPAVGTSASGASAPAKMEAVPGVTYCNRHTSKTAQDFCVVCQKPICPECMELFGYLCSVGCRYQADQKGIEVPVYKFQKNLVEARSFRKGAWITAGVVLLIVGLLGLLVWFKLVGSEPRLAYSVSLPGSESGLRTQFLGPNRMLFLTAERATLHDVKTEKDVWSTALNDASAPATEPEAEEGARKFSSYNSYDRIPPQIHIEHENLWICLGAKLKCLNSVSGEVKQTIPIPGMLVSFTPEESNILVVSATGEDRRVMTRIELASGTVTSDVVVVPRSAKHLMPDDLPPDVAPTAGVLMSRYLDDEKSHRPFVIGVSSEFFSAGQNLVELRVKLMEPKMTVVKTMKAPGPSNLNGNTSASTSTRAVAEEIFNEIKRDRTGGFRQVDESRYEVNLRRWIDQKVVGCKVEMLGAPSFFPQKTVDVVVAGKTLIAVDKQNKKLFESKLSYPVGQQYLSFRAERSNNPGLEADQTLYFIDEGMLTAFELPSGTVRWRLPSVGISRAQFDAHGMLYMNTSSAAPEDIKYSDQITFDKISPVILKVDPQSGKILWKVAKLGQQCFFSGKFLYATSVDFGGLGLANALSEALDAPQDVPVYFHVYRIDPANGKLIWDFYREQKAPEEVDFQNNQFLLRFGKEVQLLKFLSF